MGQYIEKYKKNIVIDMRKRGYSYSEIANSIHVPKSTIAFWLKGVKLTPDQAEKLKNKRSETARANFEKRRSQTSEAVEEIKKNSAKEIPKISKKELWLMGIILYWRERLLLSDKKDLQKGVNFTSSDPYMIKLFLKWLHETGDMSGDDILFDIFLDMRKKNNEDEILESIKYWSDVTEYSRNAFPRIYYHKAGKVDSGNKSGGSKNKKAGNDMKGRGRTGTKYGLLRVRVRSSSLLARQISGWMNGLVRSLF